MASVDTLGPPTPSTLAHRQRWPILRSAQAVHQPSQTFRFPSHLSSRTAGPLGCCKTLTASFERLNVRIHPHFIIACPALSLHTPARLRSAFLCPFSTCRLYPRQNLFVPINPFSSAPPRLTFRLHLPFPNPQTTPAIHLQYLLLQRKPHIPVDPSPSNPATLSPQSSWPTCGYRFQYMVRWLCPPAHLSRPCG